jgi:hypothetical protein
LLIKHHTTTLCKHVPTIETIIKCKTKNLNFCLLVFFFYWGILVLLQSIVFQAKENQEINDKLIEAARDTTKYIYLYLFNYYRKFSNLD